MPVSLVPVTIISLCRSSHYQRSVDLSNLLQCANRFETYVLLLPSCLGSRSALADASEDATARPQAIICALLW
jgi:hypothetical protein